MTETSTGQPSNKSVGQPEEKETLGQLMLGISDLLRGRPGFVLGLFLVAIGLWHVLNEVAACTAFWLPFIKNVFPALDVTIAQAVGGLPFLLLGLVVLWLQDRNLWPEVLLLALALGTCFSVCLWWQQDPHWPRTATPTLRPRVDLPIPAEKLTGGTGPLSPGQVIEIIAFVPDDKGTPVPVSPNFILEVQGLYGKDDKEIVLVSATYTRVQELQEALITTNAQFTYRLLSGTPTPIPAMTDVPTPVATFTPTPSPESGKAYLEIPTSAIDLRAGTPVTGAARLLIVEKLEAPLVVVEKGEKPAVTPVAVSTHTTTPYTVTVVAFLDGNGVRQDRYDKDWDEGKAKILIQLSVDQLANVTRSLAGAEKIWLFHVW